MNPDVVYGIILGAVGCHVVVHYVWPFLTGQDGDDEKRD